MKNFYEYGYHTEDGMTVVRKDDGYRYSSYSTDRIIAVKKAKGIQLGTGSKKINDHPLIGKKVRQRNSNKEWSLIEEVIEHFCFGKYLTLVAHDSNRSSIVFSFKNIDSIPFQGCEERFNETYEIKE